MIFGEDDNVTGDGKHVSVRRHRSNLATTNIRIAQIISGLGEATRSQSRALPNHIATGQGEAES
ncbi:hypothetical protein C5167_006048 [Papaver somniferum]|uniref:Uncharacterized protein n=1 Tax=Papaver somniferum TaxID=3469 RepID=A0A4Y7JFN7_PAPSO|nr:hypothetical protein C5167_006048 [Papaver somniferum]